MTDGGIFSHPISQTQNRHVKHTARGPYWAHEVFQSEKILTVIRPATQNEFDITAPEGIARKGPPKPSSLGLQSWHLLDNVSVINRLYLIDKNVCEYVCVIEYVLNTTAVLGDDSRAAC